MLVDFTLRLPGRFQSPLVRIGNDSMPDANLAIVTINLQCGQVGPATWTESSYNFTCEPHLTGRYMQYQAAPGTPGDEFLEAQEIYVFHLKRDPV